MRPIFLTAAKDWKALCEPYLCGFRNGPLLGFAAGIVVTLWVVVGAAIYSS